MLSNVHKFAGDLSLLYPGNLAQCIWNNRKHQFNMHSSIYCLLLEIIIRTMSKNCSHLNPVALQNQESLEKANRVSSALPPTLSNKNNKLEHRAHLVSVPIQTLMFLLTAKCLKRRI